MTAADIADLSRWESVQLRGVAFSFNGNRVPIALDGEARLFIDPEALRAIARHNTFLQRFPNVVK